MLALILYQLRSDLHGRHRAYRLEVRASSTTNRFHNDSLTDHSRPITSYGAVDLPTYFLDLTPFVPVLTDGQPHNISLDVLSAEDDHTINQNWFVSGNLQVVTDPSGKPTTGKITVHDAPLFAETTTTGNVGTNGDVNITVSATRNIHIEAEITSGSGETTQVVWEQTLSYSNTQNYLDNTFIQVGFCSRSH